MQWNAENRLVSVVCLCKLKFARERNPPPIASDSASDCERKRCNLWDHYKISCTDTTKACLHLQLTCIYNDSITVKWHLTSLKVRYGIKDILLKHIRCWSWMDSDLDVNANVFSISLITQRYASNRPVASVSCLKLT